MNKKAGLLLKAAHRYRTACSDRERLAREVLTKEEELRSLREDLASASEEREEALKELNEVALTPGEFE